jgi:nucleotide-binding universal stress UspA family protein
LPSENKVRFSKILVAIDGSDQSIKAAEYAIDIAQRYSAQLIALTVLDISKVRYSSSAFIAPPMHALEEMERMQKEAQQWFDHVGKLIEQEKEDNNNIIQLTSDRRINVSTRYNNRLR